MCVWSHFHNNLKKATKLSYLFSCHLLIPNVFLSSLISTDFRKKLKLNAYLR